MCVSSYHQRFVAVRRQGGFTLIEVMIAVAIVGILAGLTNAYLSITFMDPLRASLEYIFGSGAAWFLAFVLACGLAALALVIGVSWSNNAWLVLGATPDEFLVARGWRSPTCCRCWPIRRRSASPRS